MGDRNGQTDRDRQTDRGGGGGGQTERGGGGVRTAC